MFASLNAQREFHTKMSQYAHLFPFGKGKNLILPEDSLRLITPAKTSLVISKILQDKAQEVLPSQSTYSVIDATANHGGDTIAFALKKNFRVTAIEKDTEICQSLQHNLEQYSFGNRIEDVVCQDALEVLQERKGDILYLDPPFGEEYFADNVDQYMPQISNKTLTQIVNRNIGNSAKALCPATSSSGNFSIIALKVPRRKFPLDIFQKEVKQGTVEFYQLSNPAVMGGRHKVDLVLVLDN